MPDGWSVLYQPAVERWLDRSPTGWDIDRLLDWLDANRTEGPPDDAVRVFDDDDLYAAGVPRTGIVVTFLVIVHERLIILKEIG